MSFSELNRKLEPVDISNEFVGLPDGMVAWVKKVGNVVYFRLAIDVNTAAIAYDINIPDKYATLIEQYLVEYHNSQYRKAIGYISGNIIRLYVLNNSETIYLSASYPIADKN